MFTGDWRVYCGLSANNMRLIAGVQNHITNCYRSTGGRGILQNLGSSGPG